MKLSIKSYLELDEGETSTGANPAVVLKGRASHNRSQLIDGTRSESSGLGLAGCASPCLSAGLFEQVNIPSLDVEFFPVVCFRNRIPGQSGCEPVVASPCGSLWEGSVAIHHHSYLRFGVLIGEMLTVVDKLLVVLDRLDGEKRSATLMKSSNPACSIGDIYPYHCV